LTALGFSNKQTTSRHNSLLIVTITQAPLVTRNYSGGQSVITGVGKNHKDLDYNQLSEMLESRGGGAYA